MGLFSGDGWSGQTRAWTGRGKTRLAPIRVVGARWRLPAMSTLNWIGKEAVVTHHQQVRFRLLRDAADRARTALGSQNVVLKRGRHSKYSPLALTDHGAIMAARCAMRVMPTGEKLREGRDCTHPYVFCSLKGSRSGGRGMFAMPVAGEFSEFTRAIARYGSTPIQ